MKKVKVGNSKIHGKGLFTQEPIKKGELILPVHSGINISQDMTRFVPNQYGKFYNHDEKNFNTSNEIIGDKRYLRAIKNIPAGSELTANYREHPEMEQPEDFGKGKYASFDFDKTIATPEGLAMAKKMFKAGYNLFIVSARDKVTPDMIARARQAGIPPENIIATGSDEAKVRKVKQLGVEKHFDDKPEVISQLGSVGQQFKKGGGLNSMKYTKSIFGKNKLFVKNKLFKTKKVKNRIYDPNAKYYEDGGSIDDYMIIDIPEAQIQEYVNGGYFDNGGIYRFDERPDSQYKKDSKGNWLISNPDTKGEYVPIKDPTGSRTKTLNRWAENQDFNQAYRQKTADYDRTVAENRANQIKNFEAGIDYSALPSETINQVASNYLGNFGMKGKNLFTETQNKKQVLKNIPKEEKKNKELRDTRDKVTELVLGSNNLSPEQKQVILDDPMALGQINDEYTKYQRDMMRGDMRNYNFNSFKVLPNEKKTINLSEITPDLPDFGYGVPSIFKQDKTITVGPNKLTTHDPISGRIEMASGRAGTLDSYYLPILMGGLALPEVFGVANTVSKFAPISSLPALNVGNALTAKGLYDTGTKYIPHAIEDFQKGQREGWDPQTAFDFGFNTLKSGLSVVPLSNTLKEMNAVKNVKNVFGTGEYGVKLAQDPQDPMTHFKAIQSFGKLAGYEEGGEYSFGGIFKRRRKQEEEQPEYVEPVKIQDEMYESVTPWDKAPADFKQGVGNIKEIEVAPGYIDISREYSRNNPKEDYINERKREYLKGTNKGLNRGFGYNMENFPEQVERNFERAYNYKRNSYIVKELGKRKGFSPKRRGEWIDALTPAERNVVANSKYNSKLQPSLWDRTVAGLVTLTTPFSAQANDAMNRGELPGLTKREQREIKDSKLWGIPVGGLESAAMLDYPGLLIGNAIQASGNGTYGSDYKEAPEVLEDWGNLNFLRPLAGAAAINTEPMAGVTDKVMMTLNPINYTLPADAALLAAEGLPSLARGVKNVAEVTKDVATAHPASWFKTAGQRLESPTLWKTVAGENANSYDLIGKLKEKQYNKAMNALMEERVAAQEALLKNPNATQADFNKNIIEFAERENTLNKAREAENLKRSRVPVKPILRESGQQIGGGQGKHFLNLLDPTESVKLGTIPGKEGAMQELVNAGQRLKDAGVDLENVAIPRKAISFDSIMNTERGVQFMPWKGNPLDPKNPIAIPFDGSLRAGSETAKNKLLETVKALDKENVGVDYIGQQNILYDPATDSYKLIDLNSTKGPGQASAFNKLDLSPKERLADKIGNWNSPSYASSDEIDFLKELGAIDQNFSGELTYEQMAEAMNSLKSKKQPKPSSNFKSEIDWGKWNPDTPNHQELIDEYNAIEEAAKADGTWMKNPDGSKFVGTKPTKKELAYHGIKMTPEEAVKAQWIQQNSSWVKENMPNALKNKSGSLQGNYHNSDNKFDMFSDELFGTATDDGWYGRGNYTSTDPKYTKPYGDIRYDLYINSENPGIIDEANIDAARHYNRNEEQIIKNLQKERDELTNYAKKNKLMAFANSGMGEYGDILKYGFEKHYNNRYEKALEEALKTKGSMDHFTSLYNPYNSETVTPFKNYLKSALGNVGFFDMSNPNIYKSVLPYAVPVGLGMGMGALQQEEDGGQFNYELGDEVDEATKRHLESLGYTFEEV